MNMKKIMAMMLAVLMIVTATVAGTVAWLQDSTQDVVNVFASSDVSVDLRETVDSNDLSAENGLVKNDQFKMIPGYVLAKDPKAGVKSGSEDSLLFVKVTESDNFDDFMTYAIADGWTLLNSVTAGSAIDTVNEDTYVIYRKVTGTDIGTMFSILKNNQVAVKGTVDKTMMEQIDGKNPAEGFTEETELAMRPNLTFKAYAHQLYSTNGVEFDPAVAWANLNPNPPSV